MSDAIQVITSETEFDTTIQTGVTLVDFFAPWCRPCRTLLPILTQVAEEVVDKAKVAKVDTDQLPSLAMRFEVSAIPMLLVFKDGNIVNRFTGVQSVPTLKTAIEKACS